MKQTSDAENPIGLPPFPLFEITVCLVAMVMAVASLPPLFKLAGSPDYLPFCIACGRLLVQLGISIFFGRQALGAFEQINAPRPAPTEHTEEKREEAL